MENQRHLGEAPIGKLLLQYSVPAIIAMLVNATYNFVDRLYIGNIPDVGTLSITGVGVSLPILTIFMAFSMLIAAGAATNISLRLGEGRVKEAEALIGNAISLSVITGIFLTIIYYIFSDLILSVFGASSGSLPYAREYMHIISLGIIPWILAMALSFLIRVDGSPKRSAFIMIFGAVTKIPLTGFLIYGLNMGIAGAALSTVLVECLTMAMGLHYFLARKSNLKLTRENLKPKKPLVKMIFAIGITPFVIQIAISFSLAVTNNALKVFDAERGIGIGAMATIGAVIMVFLMPLFGLVQGMQPIVGYNYGARKLDRAKQAFKLTLIAGTVLLCIGAFFTLVLTERIVGLFTSDPELIAITVDGMRKDTFTLPLVAASIVGANYILSIGKAKLAMVLSLLRQIVILVPSLLILPKYIGLDGVWFSQPVADVLSMIIVIFVLYFEFKSYDKRYVCN